MSRKSRARDRESLRQERSFARFALIVLSLLLAAFFVLNTAALLTEYPRRSPIRHEEALRAEVTFLDATRVSPVREERRAYLLRFSDHEPLRIDFGKQAIKGAENWPAGTRLTLLLHPQDEGLVVSLTKDGEELIRFDDYLANVPLRRRTLVAVSVLGYAMCAAGAATLSMWYIRRIRQIDHKYHRA